MAAATDLKPLYLLTGSDRPKIVRAVRRLRDRVGEDSIETLDGTMETGDDAVAACNALGFFMAEARLILVEDVDKWKAPDAKAIEAYAADPTEGTVLALVAGELKKDSPLLKVGQKHGQVLEFNVVKRNLTGWVAEQFKQAGVRAEQAACAALVDIVGEDLFLLASEVDKIATWAGGDPIGESEVEALASPLAEPTIFALTDAWGRRDVGATLEASETIFERDPKHRRDVAPRLAATLGNHVSRVQACHRLAVEGVRARDGAVTLKLNPYYAEKLFAQAGNFSAEELGGAVVRLAQLDHALKGGSRVSADLELQRALVDIGREPARPERTK